MLRALMWVGAMLLYLYAPWIALLSRGYSQATRDRVVAEFLEEVRRAEATITDVPSNTSGPDRFTSWDEPPPDARPWYRRIFGSTAA